MSDFKGYFDIRDVRSTDHNFIITTFLNGVYYGDSWFSLIPKAIFIEEYRQVIMKLLASPNVIINVACLPDDPDVIIGYSILSSDFSTIHWVYVKAGKASAPWRKKGIARALLPERPSATTHLTELGKILMKKYEGLIFNPFKLN